MRHNPLVERVQPVFDIPYASLVRDNVIGCEAELDPGEMFRGDNEEN